MDLYRCSIVPIADVLTPNQFECELLTQIPLKSLSDALRACKKLHRMGPNVVVITSFSQEVLSSSTEWSLVASRVIEGTKYCEQYEIRVPQIPQYFTGTGDFFTALLLAWLHRLPNDFAQTLEHVVSTVQGALHAATQSDTKSSEVNVVHSRFIIMEPKVICRARSLSNVVANVIVHVDPLSRTGDHDENQAIIKSIEKMIGAKHVFLLEKEVEETSERLDKLLEARQHEKITPENFHYSILSLLNDQNDSSRSKNRVQQANVTSRTTLFVSPCEYICKQFASASYQVHLLDDKHSWDAVMEFIDEGNKAASIDG